MYPKLKGARLCGQLSSNTRHSPHVGSKNATRFFPSNLSSFGVFGSKNDTGRIGYHAENQSNLSDDDIEDDALDSDVTDVAFVVTAHPFLNLLILVVIFVILSVVVFVFVVIVIVVIVIVAVAVAAVAADTASARRPRC